jgi:putative transposase
MPRRRRWPSTIRRLLFDIVTLARVAVTSHAQLAAENLFLRKQLALYQERHVKAKRLDPATRVVLVVLSRVLDWRALLTVVQPETLIRWHRQGWLLLWRWNSRPGGPPIPRELQRLIVSMAEANPSWGEERIANELRLKLGLTVSPRTVGRYLRAQRPRRGGRQSQRWATFVRNHAHAVVACDFFTTVTVRFRILYVFVVLEVGTRRILHWNVTEHPTAEWTIQQFREFLAFDHPYRFVIHDRDSIFSACDAELKGFGVRVLKTPVRAPKANAYCERLVGTIRRECLYFLIPISEGHLKRILHDYVRHYNRGRPHSSLGPGIPEPPQAKVPAGPHRHKPPDGYRVTSTPVLGDLHHEYWLEEDAA